MSNVLPEVHVCIAGSHDFVRRMTVAAQQSTSSSPLGKIHISSSNIAEAKSTITAQRPQVFLVDIGLRTSTSDALWLRHLLAELRQRFQNNLYIIIAVTTPEKLVLAGDLLFADESSLVPSGLVDNLMFAPPLGFPSVASLENQFQQCLLCVAEVLGQSADGTNPLPALWAEAWVPAMADPESWSVWMRWLPRYARYTNENPLIVGPTGSGKTRLAAALHELSGRKGPFVGITPRDFSSTELVQAELFGAVAGAYTGAVEKWGLVKKADKGTLFIDELQSIDLDLQGKLITFIENKTYRRVGEAESHYADVRFVFASNKTLQSLVDEGKLRDDFAYRLERLQLVLKPLHERRLDIAAGACFALAKVLRERNEAQKSSTKGEHFRLTANPEGLTPRAYGRLFGATWPGNLRQLENTMAKLIELANLDNKTLIDEDCANEALQGLLGAIEITGRDVLNFAAQSVGSRTEPSNTTSLRDFVLAFEDSARTKALEMTGGDTTKAAALIGDSPKALELFAATRIR
jgi:transcriptional regulator with AAA-type ATPase domain